MVTTLQWTTRKPLQTWWKETSGTRFGSLIKTFNCHLKSWSVTHWKQNWMCFWWTKLDDSCVVIRQSVGRKFKGSKAVFTHCTAELKTTDTLHCGGVRVMATQEIVHRIIGKGCHSTNFGRWAWTRTQGKDGHKVQIATACHPWESAGRQSQCHTNKCMGFQTRTITGIQWRLWWKTWQHTLSANERNLGTVQSPTAQSLPSLKAWTHKKQQWTSTAMRVRECVTLMCPPKATCDPIHSDITAQTNDKTCQTKIATIQS